MSWVMACRRRSRSRETGVSDGGSSTRTVAVAWYTFGTLRATANPATAVIRNTEMASHFRRLQTSRSRR
jgi:hypothetical protein